MTQIETGTMTETTSRITGRIGTVVHVRLFAAARAAAGTETESVSVEGPVVRRDVEALLAQRHPQPVPGQPPLGQVLARSSFLLNGVACPDPEARVPTEAVLDVLPPFSGG